ncbi:MAG: PD-(D/E)XK nuclease family protein, partial [Cyclobacteriaceae bacterium]
LKPNRTFNHKFLELQEMECTYAGNKRFYNTPTGEKYPSMTSALQHRSAAAINAWRKRVGQAEADRISKKATGRGQIVHDISEQYLRNNKEYVNDFAPQYQAMFNVIKKHLNKIDNILALEAPLYSHEYSLAGRVDCIADFCNTPSIIDFKTSKHRKREEWITDYFLQTTGYSLMLEEMTGIAIEQIVIIISIEDEDTNTLDSQIFIKNRNDYIDEFDRTVEKFWELMEIEADSVNPIL